MTMVQDSPLVLAIRRLLSLAVHAAEAVGRAAERRALALKAGGSHDQHVSHLVYETALGAQEAEVKVCGCAPRFDRLLALGRRVQQAHAVKVSQYDAAFAEVGDGQERLRLAASTADRLLSGRES